MKTEFEIVFTNINVEEIIIKIKKLGGECIKQNILMKRVIYEKSKSAYARIRDEGDKITCTYKEVNNCKLDDINCVKELETTVGNFDVMKNIFEKMGLKQKAYQETKREIWKINNEIELMIDIWPGLKPFIEIEGETENIVKKYSELLGFNYKNGLFGTVDQIYLKELGIKPDIINNLTEITFENIPKK